MAVSSREPRLVECGRITRCGMAFRGQSERHLFSRGDGETASLTRSAYVGTHEWVLDTKPGGTAGVV